MERSAESLVTPKFRFFMSCSIFRTGRTRRYVSSDKAQVLAKELAAVPKQTILMADKSVCVNRSIQTYIYLLVPATPDFCMHGDSGWWLDVGRKMVKQREMTLRIERNLLF